MSWEFDLVGLLDADDPAVRGNTDLVLINGAYFDEARQSNKGRPAGTSSASPMPPRPGPSRRRSTRCS